MTRLLRFLLRLLPGDLRRRFGHDIEADLAAGLENARGPGAKARLAAGALLDLVVTAVELRRRRVRTASPAAEVASALRHATRSLRRRPAFAVGSVATLALGSALVLVAFTVLDGALLRALPYQNGERLAMVNGAATSADDVERWPAEVPGVEAAAAYSLDRAVVATPDVAMDAGILAIGPGFAELVGLPLEEGRAPTDAELRGGAPVVLVTRSLWRRIHGGATLDGQSVELDGELWTVLGIVPDAFVFFRYAEDLYRSVAHADDRPTMAAVARLAPGATIEAVREALAPAAEAAGSRVSAHLVSDTLREDLRGPLWVLFLAAGLVLVIASANVASLAIARDVERRPELAVRRALGAGRGRIVAQIVAEGFVVAAAGAALGLALAPTLLRAILSAAPDFIPAAFSLELGASSFVVAGLGVLAVTAAAGLAPALLAAGRGEGHLRSGMAREQRRAGRWMAAMLALEAAFATTLVVGSILLIRTFLVLSPSDPGFAVRDRLTVELRVPERGHPDDDAIRRWSLELLGVAGHLEGRPRAALVSYLPLSGLSAYVPARLPEADPEARPVMVHHRAVSAGYPSVMEIELLRGRGPSESDDETAPGALVLNERAVRALWPGGDDPLGRVVHLDAGGGARDFTVVGVAPDMRVLGGTTDSRPEAWTPIRQTPPRHVHLVLAPGAGPLPPPDAVRAAVAALDPAVPLLGVESLAEVVGRSMVVPRFQLTLLGVLTTAGLLLAAVGTFAVLAFRVRGLRRDLCIRQALGASRTRIGRTLAGRTLVPVALGAVAGAFATWAATGWIASRLFLYGVEPRAPGPYAVALAVVATFAFAGALLPVLRATRVDALESLREVEA